MAFPASTVSAPSSSIPNFPINLLNHTPCRPQILCLWHVRRQPFSSICAKASFMAQFGEPSNENMQNLNSRITQVKEKIREAIPEPVKELPWKKATDIAMEQLVLLGQKAFKWCFITLGLLSFFGDILFSISRNCELIIPFGLFVGCLMTDILKEALQQVIPSSEENGVGKHYLEKCFLAISCLFAAVKFVSAGLPMQARIFLLHVANGGFMQVLWLWRGLLHETDKKDVGNSDASLPMDVKS